MPVEPDDPRLTALLLGELSDAERAALEAQAYATPELAESLSGLQQTADALHRELAAETCPRLSAAQRELVFREIASASATGGTTSSGAWGALLASAGWAWLALAGLVLVVTVGLVARNVGSRLPDRAPTDSVAGQDNDARVGERRAGDRLSASGSAATAGPPRIVIRVGESLPLRVLGRVESGRERQLSPSRLQWSLDPPTGCVDFDPGTLTLRGLKATEEPVLLKVRYDQLEAQALVKVTTGSR